MVSSARRVSKSAPACSNSAIPAREQFRAVATRFDKLAAHYRAGVVIAALILWLRADG
ncbi:hypothetical protein GCM10010440_56960 [Kitasatospora cinereorecta]